MPRIASKFCPACSMYVKAERSGANHVAHLIVTLLTCWFWLPVWLFFTIANPWHCSQCGTRTEGNFSNSLKWSLAAFGIVWCGLLMTGAGMVLQNMARLMEKPAPRARPRGPVIVAEEPPVKQAIFEPNDREEVAEPATMPLTIERKEERQSRMENAARSKLIAAQRFLGMNRPDTARKWLLEVIRDYPETKAAKVAERLLEEM